jgi:capsular exopolysaccharide synthesis family protein
MSQPDIPGKMSFPDMKVTLGAALFLGLCASLGIAFLRELMDTSVRSPRDIARVGQMNLLGMIPDVDDDPQAVGGRLPLVISDAAGSMTAEQFRQLRTRLQHAASLDTTRSILVTSPGPGDGKTTVATNLAAGLALNGRRILLVDSNFKRPELHKVFGVGNDRGFSSVLASLDNFEQAAKQTKVPNLSVMGTGPKPANPTELMESQLLIDFIDRALKDYDHVIFDAGPVLLSSETTAMAPRVDGVVTVVRAKTNSRGILQRMRDTLRQLKAEHLGVVLNGVRSQGGGYYGRNIKAYYEYQNNGN